MEVETIQTIGFMALTIASWQLIYAFFFWITKSTFKEGKDSDTEADKISFGEALMFSFGGLPGCSSFTDKIPENAQAKVITMIYVIGMYGIFMYWLYQLFVVPFLEETENEEPVSQSKKKSKSDEGDFNNENNDGEESESLEQLLTESSKETKKRS